MNNSLKAVQLLFHFPNMEMTDALKQSAFLTLAVMHQGGLSSAKAARNKIFQVPIMNCK